MSDCLTSHSGESLLDTHGIFNETLPRIGAGSGKLLVPCGHQLLESLVGASQEHWKWGVLPSSHSWFFGKPRPNRNDECYYALPHIFPLQKTGAYSFYLLASGSRETQASSLQSLSQDRSRRPTKHIKEAMK